MPRRKADGSVRLKLSSVYQGEGTHVDVPAHRAVYYQLGRKKENISAKKRLLLVDWGTKYSGARIYNPRQSRQLLEWYDTGKYSMADLDPHYSVFVESTSHNRIMREGQNYLVV
jgi:hypothetical protein